MSVIKAKNLGHRFGPRPLFQRLEVEVQGGTCLGVTGANGAGKSTLLKILAGVLKPSEGRVVLHLDGPPIASEQHPLHAGCVAPWINLYEDLTLRENLAFVARVRGLPKDEEHLYQTLKSVRLHHQSDKPCRIFSSGMMQRARFAVALVAKPPLLILDEPTVNLDRWGREDCRRLVRQAKGRGCIVVVASNVAEDLKVADWIISVEDYAPRPLPVERVFWR